MKYEHTHHIIPFTPNISPPNSFPFTDSHYAAPADLEFPCRPGWPLSQECSVFLLFSNPLSSIVLRMHGHGTTHWSTSSLPPASPAVMTGQQCPSPGWGPESTSLPTFNIWLALSSAGEHSCPAVITMAAPWPEDSISCHSSPSFSSYILCVPYEMSHEPLGGGQ